MPETTLTLSVGATGSSLTYQWSFGPNVIVGATNAVYTKTNVSRADAGSYTCAVTSGTTVVSDAAIVGITDPAINVQPANVIAATGSNALFNVTAAGTPTLSYIWLNNGVRMKDSATIKGSATASLTIEKVTAAHAGGPYSVIVSNGPTTTITSQGATLTVFDAPVVKVAPPSHTVSAGQSYTLKATITKGATGQSFGLQWYKDSVLIPGATTSTYTISSPEPIAAGTYSITMTNESGISATSGSVISVTADTSAPKTILLMSPKAPAVTKPAWVSGTSVDATVTNVAPTIDMVAKFVDPKGLLVGGYFTNLSSALGFNGGFCVSQTVLTPTNAVFGKPAFFHGLVTLVDGTNLIQAVAQDYGTNSASSKTNVFYYMANPSSCTFSNNGTGKITAKVMDKIWGLASPAPIVAPLTLEVGHRYTIQAVTTWPLGAHVTFVGWDLTDPSASISQTSVSTTQNLLEFEMRTDLSITARFSNGH